MQNRKCQSSLNTKKSCAQFKLPSKGSKELEWRRTNGNDHYRRRNMQLAARCYEKGMEVPPRKSMVYSKKIGDLPYSRLKCDLIDETFNQNRELCNFFDSSSSSFLEAQDD